MAKNVRKLQLEIDRGLKQTDEVSFHPPAPPTQFARPTNMVNIHTIPRIKMEHN